MPKYEEKIISLPTVLCIRLTLLSDVLIMSDLCCHCPTHACARAPTPRMCARKHAHTHVRTLLEVVMMTDM